MDSGMLRRFILYNACRISQVKVWDLEDGKCIQTYSHHKNKVQNVRWNNSQPTVLLTGSFDKSCMVFDSRAPEVLTSTLFYDVSNQISFT